MQYYTSEITAVSEKTLVVNFLEYGNFEEVLKADVLPYTEGQSNHHQQNSGNQTQMVKHQNNSSRGGNVGTRQRNDERRHYVPPAQRKSYFKA